MAFRNLKHLPRSTASDKILCDKAINISKTPTYDGFQTGLTSMVYKLFDKNGSNGGVRRADNLPLKIKISQTSNWLKNYTNHLLESLNNKKYTHLL